MRGVFERRCSRNISSSPRNSSTATPCLQLRQIQGYDCLLVHVRSPVGMVPRIRHLCLATNQSQVRQRLPWFRGSRKQCIASCASACDLTPAIRSSPAVRSTSLDTVKRMSSLWSCCCRYVCALPVRLQSPRHSFFLGTHLCESALSELTRIVEHGLLDMDGVHIGANWGLRVAYRCLHRQLHDVPSVTARS